MKQITRRSVLAGATLIPATAIRSAAQTVPEMALLEAAVDRIIPPDHLGPGAKDCGATGYVAPLLDQPLRDGLASIDSEARAKFGKPFVELPAANQDEVLTAIETKARPFFNRLRQLTLEGTFGDPSYGGNRAFAGWDLIRYPGPRLAVSPEEQKLRDPIKPVRRS